MNIVHRDNLWEKLNNRTDDTILSIAELNSIKELDILDIMNNKFVIHLLLEYSKEKKFRMRMLENNILYKIIYRFITSDKEYNIIIFGITLYLNLTKGDILHNKNDVFKLFEGFNIICKYIRESNYEEIINISIGIISNLVKYPNFKLYNDKIIKKNNYNIIRMIFDEKLEYSNKKTQIYIIKFYLRLSKNIQIYNKELSFIVKNKNLYIILNCWTNNNKDLINLSIKWLINLIDHYHIKKKEFFIKFCKSIEKIFNSFQNETEDIKIWNSIGFALRKIFSLIDIQKDVFSQNILNILVKFLNSINNKISLNAVICFAHWSENLEFHQKLFNEKIFLLMNGKMKENLTNSNEILNETGRFFSNITWNLEYHQILWDYNLPTSFNNLINLNRDAKIINYIIRGFANLTFIPNMINKIENINIKPLINFLDYSQKYKNEIHENITSSLANISLDYKYHQYFLKEPEISIIFKNFESEKNNNIILNYLMILSNLSMNNDNAEKLFQKKFFEKLYNLISHENNVEFKPYIINYFSSLSKFNYCAKFIIIKKIIKKIFGCLYENIKENQISILNSLFNMIYNIDDLHNIFFENGGINLIEYIFKSDLNECYYISIKILSYLSSFKENLNKIKFYDLNFYIDNITSFNDKRILKECIKFYLNYFLNYNNSDVESYMIINMNKLIIKGIENNEENEENNSISWYTWQFISQNFFYHSFFLENEILIKKLETLQFKYIRNNKNFFIIFCYNMSMNQNSIPSFLKNKIIMKLSDLSFELDENNISHLQNIIMNLLYNYNNFNSILDQKIECIIVNLFNQNIKFLNYSLLETLLFYLKNKFKNLFDNLISNQLLKILNYIDFSLFKITKNNEKNKNKQFNDINIKLNILSFYIIFENSREKISESEIVLNYIFEIFENFDNFKQIEVDKLQIKIIRILSNLSFNKKISKNILKYVYLNKILDFIDIHLLEVLKLLSNLSYLKEFNYNLINDKILNIWISEINKYIVKKPEGKSLKIFNEDEIISYENIIYILTILINITTKSTNIILSLIRMNIVNMIFDIYYWFKRNLKIISLLFLLFGNFMLIDKFMEKNLIKVFEIIENNINIIKNKLYDNIDNKFNDVMKKISGENNFIQFKLYSKNNLLKLVLNIISNDQFNFEKINESKSLCIFNFIFENFIKYYNNSLYDFNITLIKNLYYFIKNNDSFYELFTLNKKVYNILINKITSDNLNNILDFNLELKNLNIDQDTINKIYIKMSLSIIQLLTIKEKNSNLFIIDGLFNVFIFISININDDYFSKSSKQIIISIINNIITYKDLESKVKSLLPRFLILLNNEIYETGEYLLVYLKFYINLSSRIELQEIIDFESFLQRIKKIYNLNENNSEVIHNILIIISNLSFNEKTHTILLNLNLWELLHNDYDKIDNNEVYSNISLLNLSLNPIAYNIDYKIEDNLIYNLKLISHVNKITKVKIMLSAFSFICNYDTKILEKLEKNEQFNELLKKVEEVNVPEKNIFYIINKLISEINIILNNNNNVYIINNLSIILYGLSFHTKIELIKYKSDILWNNILNIIFNCKEIEIKKFYLDCLINFSSAKNFFENQNLKKISYLYTKFTDYIYRLIVKVQNKEIINSKDITFEFIYYLKFLNNLLKTPCYIKEIISNIIINKTRLILKYIFEYNCMDVYVKFELISTFGYIFSNNLTKNFFDSILVFSYIENNFRNIIKTHKEIIVNILLLFNSVLKNQKYYWKSKPTVNKSIITDDYSNKFKNNINSICDDFKIKFVKNKSEYIKYKVYSTNKLIIKVIMFCLKINNKEFVNKVYKINSKNITIKSSINFEKYYYETFLNILWNLTSKNDNHIILIKNKIIRNLNYFLLNKYYVKNNYYAFALNCFINLISNKSFYIKFNWKFIIEIIEFIKKHNNIIFLSNAIKIYYYIFNYDTVNNIFDNFDIIIENICLILNENFNEKFNSFILFIIFYIYNNYELKYSIIKYPLFFNNLFKFLENIDIENIYNYDRLFNILKSFDHIIKKKELFMHIKKYNFEKFLENLIKKAQNDKFLKNDEIINIINIEMDKNKNFKTFLKTMNIIIEGPVNCMNQQEYKKIASIILGKRLKIINIIFIYYIYLIKEKKKNKSKINISFNLTTNNNVTIKIINILNVLDILIKNKEFFDENLIIDLISEIIYLLIKLSKYCNEKIITNNIIKYFEPLFDIIYVYKNKIKREINYNNRFINYIFSSLKTFYRYFGNQEIINVLIYFFKKFENEIISNVVLIGSNNFYFILKFLKIIDIKWINIENLNLIVSFVYKFNKYYFIKEHIYFSLEFYRNIIVYYNKEINITDTVLKNTYEMILLYYKKYINIIKDNNFNVLSNNLENNLFIITIDIIIISFKLRKNFTILLNNNIIVMLTNILIEIKEKQKSNTEFNDSNIIGNYEFIFKNYLFIINQISFSKLFIGFFQNEIIIDFLFNLWILESYITLRMLSLKALLNFIFLDKDLDILCFCLERINEIVEDNFKIYLENTYIKDEKMYFNFDCLIKLLFTVYEKLNFNKFKKKYDIKSINELDLGTIIVINIMNIFLFILKSNKWIDLQINTYFNKLINFILYEIKNNKLLTKRFIYLFNKIINYHLKNIVHFKINKKFINNYLNIKVFQISFKEFLTNEFLEFCFKLVKIKDLKLFIFKSLNNKVINEDIWSDNIWYYIFCSDEDITEEIYKLDHLYFWEHYEKIEKKEHKILDYYFYLYFYLTLWNLIYENISSNDIKYFEDIIESLGLNYLFIIFISFKFIIDLLINNNKGIFKEMSFLKDKENINSKISILSVIRMSLYYILQIFDRLNDSYKLYYFIINKELNNSNLNSRK